MTLAAGPDSTVSIGRWVTKSAETSEPSPRTIMRRASSCRESMAARIASAKPAVTEMSCALSSVVTARRGPPSRGDSS